MYIQKKSSHKSTNSCMHKYFIINYYGIFFWAINKLKRYTAILLFKILEFMMSQCRTQFHLNPFSRLVCLKMFRTNYYTSTTKEGNSLVAYVVGINYASEEIATSSSDKPIECNPSIYNSVFDLI